MEGASTIDLLGENGRRAINASVKVSVCKKREPCKYYSKNEAKCIVQGCSLGDVDQDVAWNQVFKANFYDICDIQDILALLEFRSSRSNGRKCDEKELETVMNRREKIKAEYIECAENMEMVEHGTGTVIQKHFVVTCRHVVETVLFDNRNEHVIFISNEQTDNKLFCKVIYDDTAKDLALLHCPKLNASKICPLKLSHKIQKVGFQFFCFGYPINHHGIKALCVHGMISGSNPERYGRPELMVLCSSGLNHGFSGGPVLLKYDCEMVMIGIVKEKQIERMLTREDEEFVGQVCTQGIIAENIDDLTARKIQERLEQIDHKLNEGARNYPSGLSNAITGASIQEFLNEAGGTYKGWDCGELKELTYTLIPRINKCLQEFKSQWENHTLSSEGNLSPIQLYTAGMLENKHSEYAAIECVFDACNRHDYGFDPSAPVPLEEEDYQVVVPDTSVPLSDQQMVFSENHCNPLQGNGRSGGHYPLLLEVDADEKEKCL